MKRLNVAIAEDEVLIADLLHRIVETSGHAVVGCARTGEERVAMVERERPDLVLVDIKLARGSDGLTAARTVQSRFGVPAIAITAHLTPEEARGAGLLGFLSKPFTLRKVEQTLASAAERLEKGAEAPPARRGSVV